MLHRSSFADNVIDSFAFFLFGCFDGILQQPPFQLLAVEIDVLAVGFEMGDSPLVGKLVHVGLRQPRKFACFGEVQDCLLPPKQSFDAVEPLLDGCVFTHNHSVFSVQFLAPFLASAESVQARLCARLIEKVR